MQSADWLHRKFLYNIDYIERQLLYHRRYVTCLVNVPCKEGLRIVPRIFEKHLRQESDACMVVDERLKALRTRATVLMEAVRASRIQNPTAANDRPSVLALTDLWHVRV